MANKLTVGELVYKISGDMDNLKTELAKSEANVKDLQKSMTELAESIKTSTNKSSKGVESLSSSVFKGTAQWDMLKESIKTTVAFLQDSIEESTKAAAVMAQVENNVKNAGFSYSDLSEKIKEAGDSAIQLGFDDEDASLAFSKFLLVTKDVSKSMSLLTLTQDLARAKGIDLMSANQALLLTLQGNARALKELGINMNENVSVAEALKLAQDAVKGSAESFANTSAGSLATLQNQYANLKQELGDKLAPVLLELFKKVEEHLPEIEAGAENLGDALVKLIELIIKLAPLAEDVAVAFVSWKIGTFISGLVETTVALGGVTGAVKALTVALAANPIGIIAVGLGLAVDQAIKLKNNLEEIANKKKKEAEVTANLGNTQLAYDLKTYQNMLNEISGLDKKSEKYKTLSSQMKSMDKEITQLGGSTKNMSAEVNKLNSNPFAGLTSGAKSANDTLKEMKDKLFDVIQKSQELSENLKNDLAKSVLKFSDSLKDITSDSTKNFSDIVVNAEKEITDLKKQLADEQSKSADQQSADNIKKLNNEIAEKQKILTSYANFQTDLNNEIARVQKALDQNNTDAAANTDPTKQSKFDATSQGLQMQIDALKGFQDLDKQVAEARKLAGEDDFKQAEINTFAKIQLATNLFIEETTKLREKQAVAIQVEQSVTDFYKTQTLLRQKTLDAFATSSIATMKRIGDEAKSALAALNSLRSAGAQIDMPVNTIQTPTIDNLGAGNSTSSNTTNNTKNVNTPVTINANIGSNVDASQIAKELAWQISKK